MNLQERLNELSTKSSTSIILGYERFQFELKLARRTIEDLKKQISLLNHDRIFLAKSRETFKRLYLETKQQCEEAECTAAIRNLAYQECIFNLTKAIKNFCEKWRFKNA